MNEKEIIFLVEDNKTFSLLTQKKLENQFAATVHAFGTGELMLEFIQNNPNTLPDLIILDYYLNSEVENAKNGEEILEEIKKLKKQDSLPKKLPVIILTAANELKMAVSLLQAGAVDYILKDDGFYDNLAKTIQNIKDIRHYQAEIELHKQKATAYKKRMIVMGTIIFVLVASLIGFLLTL